MTNTDRSKQQFSEAPQTTRQQGARSGQVPDSRNPLPAQRGSYEPSRYTGRGQAEGPFAMMRRLSDEMDRIFESFGVGGPMATFGPATWPERSGLQALWAPHIEVCEREGKLLIQADLPGVRKEDVNVQIEHDAIILQGERRQEETRDERGFYHTERSYGSFQRVIPLPEGVDSDQAKAKFRDGVLTIELPAPQQRRGGRTLTIEDQGQAEGGNEPSRNAPAGRQQG